MHLGQSYLNYKNRLGGECVENSEEKDLMVLADEKLNMCQHCAPAAQKASGILASIRRGVASKVREGIASFCSAFVRPQLCSSLGPPTQEKHGAFGEGQDDQRAGTPLL